MSGEEVVLLTDEELEMFLSDNQLNDFMREVKKISVPTSEENLQLVRKYKSYKAECAEKTRIQNELLERNLRLIVSIAYKKVRRAKSFTVLDLVNVGSIGFIESLDKFDLSCGTQLSTYVVPRIKQAMAKALKDKDKDVRRSVHFEEKMDKFRALVEKYYHEGRTLPNDDSVLADMLDVSEDTVRMMREDYKLDTTSMETKVGDGEGTELGDLVGRDDDGYSDVLNKIVDKEMCMMLKSVLAPSWYFIVYYRIISPESKTLQDLSLEMGVTSERIRQLEAKALRSLKKLFVNRSILSKNMANIREDYDLENCYSNPVEPAHIAFFFFIRNSLTKEEKELYKLLLYRMENHADDYYAERLGLSLNCLGKVYESLMDKIKQHKDAFEPFKRAFVEEFKSKIYSLDLDGPMPTLYKSTLEHWNSVILSENPNSGENVTSVDENYGLARKLFIKREVNQLLAASENLFSEQIRGLIKRYFSFVLESPIPMEKAEKELNVIANGFRIKAAIPHNTLYDVAVQNRDEFTEEQFDYMCAHVFNRMKKRDFNAKYPSSNVGDSTINLIMKLERLYFKPARNFSYNFTKERFESLREKCLQKGLDEEVAILDLFFGVGCESHGIEEIAVLKGIEYLEAQHLVRTARERCLSCYLNKSRYKEVDVDLYLPYLLNDEYGLNERGKGYALEHFAEGKTYKEIGDSLGLKSTAISDAVNNVLRQIDFYRFGILTRENRYSDDFLKKEMNTDLFTDKEKEIVECAIDTRDYITTAKKFGTTHKNVTRLTKKLFNRCYDKTVAAVNVTPHMIIKEVTRHVSETILRDEERIVLSYIYGIVCDVNPIGEVLNTTAIRERFGYSVVECSKYKNNGIKSIAARKCGLIKPQLAFMERSKVAALLSNPCLPLSVKEKEMLLYFFELQGYPRKSLKELADMYGMVEDSARRKIRRAFASMYKYEFGEIPGIVSFEEHVMPNLKYFPKSDQMILISIYRDGLSVAEIARRAGLTRDVMDNRVFKAQVYLKNILGAEQNLFDYDYFEEHVMDEDIPFYGDKELAYKIWRMMYEDKMSSTEIIAALNLSYTETTLFRDMDILMCAVLKRKMGVKKCREFSYEEIRQYYLEHCDEMPVAHKGYYYRYFKRKEKWESRQAPRFATDVSMDITFDLIRDRGEGYFSLDSLTREQALDLMRKYRSEMSRECFLALACRFRIQGKDFMSGSDQNKVLKALSYVETKQMLLEFNKKTA